MATSLQMDVSVVGDKAYSINEDGLAHIGMLPDLVADFEAMGLTERDLEPLMTSAQGYVDLWKRASSGFSFRHDIHLLPLLLTDQREKAANSPFLMPLLLFG